MKLRGKHATANSTKFDLAAGTLTVFLFTMIVVNFFLLQGGK